MTGQHTFEFTPQAAGVYRFSTAGSDFDTVLAILEGQCGESIACNDDHEGLQSQLEQELAAGQTVTIAVGGFRLNRGQYILRVERLEVDAAGEE